YFGNDVFDAWGWRVPFLFSFLLVAIAIYIRLQLQETPVFQEIKAKGQTTKNPWREAFLSANIKFVLIASIVVIGEGVVWYSGQFWALYFLQQVSKVDVVTSSFIVGIALLIATPTLIIFGGLSDKIGRKPVILAGFLLAALTYYPLYSWLGEVTHPGNINYPVAVLIIAILVSYVGMVYGPIGAFLAEYFPGRIRYTSVSVPYHIGKGRRQHGRAEVKSLVLIAAELREEGELLGGLHTLRDHLQMQTVGERDDGTHDRRVFRTPRHVFDEAAVDLQLVDRKAAQVAHARVAGAEVVDRHQHAHAADGFQDADRLLRIAHDGALGELDLEKPRIQRSRIERPPDLVDEVREPEL